MGCRNTVVFSVKVLIILVLALVQPFLVSAGVSTLEELSSHFFTNGPIIWQASTNHLPKQFWIYQRHLPRIFPATVITNAIVLGSLESKGFPQASTNQTCILADPPCPCGNVCNFSINPSEASMSFESPNYKDGPPNGIPNDETIAKRAWDYVPQLGLDPAQLIKKSFFTHSYNVDKNGKDTTNFICGRGIFLSRQLDGVDFFSVDGTDDGDAEGFSIEFGGYGQIRYYSFRWSAMERYESQQTASPQEIIHCIIAHKTIVLPNGDEESYFARLRALANARKLTITKITPVYGEGVFGEPSTSDTPCKFATPFAELEAIADFGASNATVRLVSPILSSEVKRLLQSN
jgi:hypothetical protein